MVLFKVNLIIEGLVENEANNINNIEILPTYVWLVIMIVKKTIRKTNAYLV